MPIVGPLLYVLRCRQQRLPDVPTLLRPRAQTVLAIGDIETRGDELWCVKDAIGTKRRIAL